MHQLPSELTLNSGQAYMKTMGMNDHIYMVVGCVNLLDLRIVASVILSVTVVNIS